MATAFPQLRVGRNGAVVAFQFSLLLAAWRTTVGDTSRNLPFLDSDDPGTICENAIRYSGSQTLQANSRAAYTGKDQSPLPLPSVATPATRLVANSGVRSSETPGNSPVTVSVNSSIYAPRKPHLGKILTSLNLV